MNLVAILFYMFVALAALSAVGLVLVRHVFYGALFVLAGLLALAGIYILCLAEFVAVAQILVYAGGVLVVIIFGIMITARLGAVPLRIQHGNIFSGVLAGVSFFGLMAYVILQQPFPTSADTPVPPDTLEPLGTALVTDYALPFEVAGILLLVALVGAAVIAAHLKTNKS